MTTDTLPPCPHCGRYQWMREQHSGQPPEYACLCCGFTLYGSEPLPFIPLRDNPAHRGESTRRRTR